MKNTGIKTISLIFVALLLIASCKKETNSGTKFPSLNIFLEQNKITSQSFTVNASAGGTITGAKGTVVTFPPNAFLDGNGNRVTGNVSIELKEVFNKADMIAAGVFPVAYGSALLNSGGEYFLSATQNGNKVNLEKGRFFQMRLPAQAADPNMQFFLQADNDTLAGINWVLPDTAVVNVDSQWVVSPVGGFSFTTTPDSAYVITCDSLGWGNADVFMSPTYVTCSFVVTGGSVTDANTKGYCLYDGKNTVWPAGMYGSIANNTITDSHIANIPIHFLVISVINGELYAGSTAVTPAEGGSYPITIAPITKTALDALILSFN